jgi:hypothetical protein
MSSAPEVVALAGQVRDTIAAVCILLGWIALFVVGWYLCDR